MAISRKTHFLHNHDLCLVKEYCNPESVNSKHCNNSSTSTKVTTDQGPCISKKEQLRKQEGGTVQVYVRWPKPLECKIHIHDQYNEGSNNIHNPRWQTWKSSPIVLNINPGANSSSHTNIKYMNTGRSEELSSANEPIPHQRNPPKRFKGQSA